MNSLRWEKAYTDLNPPKYWMYAVDANGNIQYDAKREPNKDRGPICPDRQSTAIPSCDNGDGVNAIIARTVLIPAK